MFRTSITTLALILAMGACKKDKTDGTTPADKKPTVDKVAKGKTAPAEVVDALAKAKAGCASVHDAADPEKAKDVYDAVAAQKTYETECKAPLDMALGKDATLATYKGELNGKAVDVVAIKTMASAIPGRIEIAKASYEEAAALKKEEEKKIWEPLLKNDKLKVFQEKGKPSSSNATATEPPAIAQATIWIYESAPRDQDGKQVVDKSTYKFKKDGKLDGKAKNEVVDYIAPE